MKKPILNPFIVPRYAFCSKASNNENKNYSQNEKEILLRFDDIDQTNVADKYDKIAATYEDMCDLLGYPDPGYIVKAFLKLNIPKDAPIIDFGCGTGLLGEELEKDGFTNIVGIDCSAEMLKGAEKRGCYKELRKVFLCSNSFPQEYTKKFDVAVSSAVLTHFLSPEVFEEKLESLRPKESEDDKRYLIFATRMDVMDSQGFTQKLEDLEEDGRMKLLETTSFTRYENMKDKGEVGIFRAVPGKCFVYEV